MKRHLAAAVVLVAVAFMGWTRADQKEDDAAIGKRHDEWCAAWNKHKANEMAGFFVADGGLINPFGRRAKGTAEIEKLFEDEQKGVMAGTTYSGTIEGIRYIGDVAIVD